MKLSDQSFKKRAHVLRKNRLRIIRVTAFVLTLVSLLIVITELGFKEQSVVLADGSTLLFRSVTFGVIHTPPPSGWLESVHRLLPKSIRARIGTKLQPARYARTPTHSFGIWVEHIGAKGPYGGPVHLWARELTDAASCSVETKSWSWPTEQGSTKQYFVPVTISSRSDTVTLGVFQMADFLEFQEMARFTIKNPLGNRAEP